MKSKSIIVFILIIVFSIIFVILTSSESKEDYIRSIETFREKQALFMEIDPTSPFKQDSSIVFTQLNYYPIDLTYKITANLIFSDTKKIITLPTSDGNQDKYLTYACASFTLADKKHQLLILESTEKTHPGELFLSFADQTSGAETYGAGRYINLKKNPGASTIVIDFNMAYNPYCAYSSAYSCPLPPAENKLQIPIKAGEKNYH